MMRLLPGVLAAAMLMGCPKKPVTGPNLLDDPTEPNAPTVTDVIGEDQRVPIHQRINDAADLLVNGGEAGRTRAISILEGVISEEPDNAAAHFNLGVAQHLGGDLGEARISYQRAVDADPDMGDGWLYLGLAQIESGRQDIGIANFRTGIRRVPEHGDLRAALVQALRERGDLDEAIAEAKEALKSNSNSLSLYNNLGLAYLDKGDVELAKFVFRKGIDGVVGGSENAWLHTNLGRSFLVEGDRVTAQYYLERAVELDSEGVPGLVYLSGIYLDDRNYADAVPMLETALERDPENHGVMVNLGLAYRGVERFDDAEELYRRALRTDLTSPAPLLNLAVLYGDYLKDYERATEMLQQYIDRRGAHRELAATYIEEFEREQGRAARRREAEADAARRDRQRAERERLLREAEAGGSGTEEVVPPGDDGDQGDDAPPTPWGEEP